MRRSRSDCDARSTAAAGGPRYLQTEVVFVAVLCALATLFFGIDPDPLLNVARDASTALITMCAGGGMAPAIIIERV